MRIRIAYLEQELLWVLDDVIGGLYSIDQQTFETKCVIDCQKLFPYGKFEVLSLFVWKEDYIVIVPLEINRSWIFYNRVTGEIGYRKVTERKCREVLVTVDQNRNQLYFIPIYRYDPILIINLNTLTCSQIIENWSDRMPSNCRETVWKAAYNGQYIFFPIKNTKTLARMDCEIQKVKLLELNISERAADVDYAFGELWLLPVSGNKLYQIDENGQIINTIELLIKDVAELLPNFVRIVVQKKYIFLIPCYHKGIYVYDKINGETHIILENISISKKNDREIYLHYWEYCIKDNQICFLPFESEYIEIDLNTLAYKKKELSYPNMWSDKEKIWRNIWTHVSEGDSVIREAVGCSLKVFLKYNEHKIYKGDFPKNKNVGNEIWNLLVS